MGTANDTHAAMLQIIAEGIRSPAAGRLSQAQLERVAGLLDRIAVELLMPTPNTDEEPSRLLAFANATNAECIPHSN